MKVADAQQAQWDWVPEVALGTYYVPKTQHLVNMMSGLQLLGQYQLRCDHNNCAPIIFEHVSDTEVSQTKVWS